MTQPVKATKRPVTIETMRFAGSAESAVPVIDWILSGRGTARFVGEGEYHSLRYPSEVVVREGIAYDTQSGEATKNAPCFIVIDTLEGRHRANPGDYILRGVQGEFYPCKPDIFEGTYTVDHEGDSGSMTLEELYPEVAPFVQVMYRELAANSHKGDQDGWRKMGIREAWGELAWHLGKLAGAMKADDEPLMRELLADIANGAMMFADILDQRMPTSDA